MIQGTQEWLDARCGKITASDFSKVLAKGRGGEEFGKTAMTYAHEKVTEILTGIPVNTYSNAAMEWGNETEPFARDEYVKHTFNNVEQVGFIELNNWVGSSPDGLVSNNGGIEIKCPYNSTVHLNNLLKKKAPSEYIAQIQGNMYVTGRKWWDFVSFDPRYKDIKNQIVIVRVKRDEEYIKNLEIRIKKFISIINSILDKLS